jgi:LacI family gluconate utilization system Gnt-I transcriptional repressor
VPDDLALAGFNGLSIGQALPRPLTTIASQREHIGFVAASHLLDRLAGGRPPRVTNVDFRLIPGATA